MKASANSAAVVAVSGPSDCKPFFTPQRMVEPTWARKF